MRRLLPAAALLAALSVPAPGIAQAQAPARPDAAPRRDLVHVFVRDAVSLAQLQALDLDLAGCTAIELPVRQVEVITRPGDLARITAAGLDYELVIEDLEGHYARQLASEGPALTATNLVPAVGQGGMGGHYTLAEMETILDALHQQYPALCSAKVSLGRSLQGRELWMVKISDNVGTDENEPEVFYDAVHHAREPLSMTTTLQFMSDLLDGYGSDPEATFLVDERELYFVPCVNPDGYEYNRQTNPGGGGMWRKNRRNHGGGTFGVDLNRNYATGWSAPNGGNSTNPSSDTYRGSAPFSEPESQAIEAFVASRNFTQVCSCHTYTEVLLHPFGYLNGQVSNLAEYQQLGARFTATSGMPFGSVSGLLYIAAGGSVDHHHQVHGAVAWTPELGRRNEGGFWPARSSQIAISQRHQRMFREMAATAGALLEYGDIVVREAPGGGDGDGRVEPGEVGEVIVTVHNQGLTSAAAANVALTSAQTGITILNGSTSLPGIVRFGRADNAAAPLTFAVQGSFSDPFIQLRLTLTGDGRSAVRDLDVVEARPLVVTDMEVDSGFALAPASTATTGRWERSTSVQTTSSGRVIQPAGQATPGGQLCWITDGRSGSSAGSYDVDGGFADLLSPVLDLRHVIGAELRFQVWYVDSVGDDALELAVSTDGGQNWSALASRSQASTSWEEWRVPLTGVALSAQTVFRIRAQDNNPSLVEAGVDDFAIWGGVRDGDATLLSSGLLGSQLQLGVGGEAGGLTFALFGAQLGGPTQIPGIDGLLELAPASVLAAVSQPVPAVGVASYELTIPNDPTLRGNTLHLQALHGAAGSWRFGNLQSVTLR